MFPDDIFDLDGDGKSSLLEEFLCFCAFYEDEEEEKKKDRDYSWDIETDFDDVPEAPLKEKDKIEEVEEEESDDYEPNYEKEFANNVVRAILPTCRCDSFDGDERIAILLAYMKIRESHSPELTAERMDHILESLVEHGTEYGLTKEKILSAVRQLDEHIRQYEKNPDADIEYKIDLN